MPTFAGFAAGLVVAMVVNDALKPFGFPPLRVMLCMLTFYMAFWFIRQILQETRPDL